MGGDRSRVLVLAIAYVAAIVLALFVIEWFTIDLGVASIPIGLRDGRGFYGAMAAAAFWGSLLLVIPAVAFQTFTRLTTGVVNAKLSRNGILAALVVLVAGLGAGYLFAPEIPGPRELVPAVERTIAPLLFIVANGLAIATLHYAAIELTDDSAGTYKPVVVSSPTRSSSTQPPINRPATQPPINKPITQPPITRSPTSPIAPVPKHALSYLVMSGEVTRAGIDARRQDGSSLLVLWRDVVGVVVRRLPDELDATTFMDIVSFRGRA